MDFHLNLESDNTVPVNFDTGTTLWPPTDRMFTNFATINQDDLIHDIDSARYSNLDEHGADVQVAKSRGKNWQQEETDVLLHEVANRKEKLEGRLTPYWTKQNKNKEWEVVAQIVSALGNLRTGDECWKRWKNLKSRAVREVSDYKKENRKTGGGKSTAEVPSDDSWLAASIIGKSKTEGISNGMELGLGGNGNTKKPDQEPGPSRQKDEDSNQPPSTNRKTQQKKKILDELYEENLKLQNEKLVWDITVQKQKHVKLVLQTEKLKHELSNSGIHVEVVDQNN